MTLETKPLADITNEAMHLLFKHLGTADTIRFINQFSTGYGDYTIERRELFRTLKLDDIVSEIERMRKE